MRVFDFWTLIQVSLVVTVGFRGLFVIGKWVDKVDPEDRKHRPTRYSEVIAPYIASLGLLGLLVGAVGLLIEKMN